LHKGDTVSSPNAADEDLSRMTRQIWVLLTFFLHVHSFGKMTWKTDKIRENDMERPREGEGGRERDRERKRVEPMEG